MMGETIGALNSLQQGIQIIPRYFFLLWTGDSEFFLKTDRDVKNSGPSYAPFNKIQTLVKSHTLIQHHVI